MARLLRTPGEGQDPLFSLSELVPDAPQAPEVSTIASEVDGAYVSIEMRALALGATLRELNKANRSAGLQVAATTPYRTELEARYGRRGVDPIVEAAAEKEPVYIRRARKYFMQAVGREAMLDAGFDPVETNRRTSDMFSAFTARYGVGVTTAKVRNDYANKVQKSADVITGKRSSSGRKR